MNKKKTCGDCKKKQIPSKERPGICVSCIKDYKKCVDCKKYIYYNFMGRTENVCCDCDFVRIENNIQ